MMIRPKLMKFALAGMLAMGSAMAADVVIRVGPPRPLVERRGPPPGREYVWINGYHQYDGGHYVWVPGRWDAPPRRHAHWVAHHWVRRNGGWVLVEGHWR